MANNYGNTARDRAHATLEPLSVTTSLVSLLNVCLGVCLELRKLRYQAPEGRAPLTAMLTDVKALRSILVSMEDAFEEVDTGPPVSGKLAALWKNLLLAVHDGGDGLMSLGKLVKKVNQDISMDPNRRSMGLQAVTEHISLQRQEVQAYRDAMQLVLHTVGFYGLVTTQENSIKARETPDALRQSVSRLATNLDVRLLSLEAHIRKDKQHSDMARIGRLKDLVRFAATVISAASAILNQRERSNNIDSIETAPYSLEIDAWGRAESGNISLPSPSPAGPEQEIESADDSPKALPVFPSMPVRFPGSSSARNQPPRRQPSINQLSAPQSVNAQPSRGTSSRGTSSRGHPSREQAQAFDEQDSDLFREQASDLFREQPTHTSRQQLPLISRDQAPQISREQLSRTALGASPDFSLSFTRATERQKPGPELRRQPSDTRRQPPDLRHQPSDLRRQPSDLRRQPSDSRHQLSELKRQPSELKRQPSELKRQPSQLRRQAPELRHQRSDLQIQPKDPRSQSSRLQSKVQIPVPPEQWQTTPDIRKKPRAATNPLPSAENIRSAEPKRLEGTITPTAHRNNTPLPVTKVPILHHKKSLSFPTLWGGRSKESVGSSNKDAASSTSNSIQGYGTAMVRLKFVFVGNGGSGKTCFLIRASKGTMPEIYAPTIFENYITNFEVDGKRVETELWDTAGQEDWDRVRPLSYPDTDAFFICFGIDDPYSLENVLDKWNPEVLQFGLNKPIFLLGLKSDLRFDAGTMSKLLKYRQHPVSRAEAEEVAGKIRAVRYMECSAKSGEGITEIFAAAVRVALEQGAQPRKSSKTQKKGLRARLFKSVDEPL